MKKQLFLLLAFLSLSSYAQVSNGQEQQFDYGIQNLAPQTILASPDFITTSGNDGTYGQIPYDNLLNGRVAQGDTGVLDFGGLTTNSATTINIGFVDGYVVDNETNSSEPVFTHVSYAGASNVTVTTVGSGQASYVMLDSGGVISFQNTLPTSAERKAKIWLGKVSHPAGSITLVINEPDYITSPMAFSRDMFQALGPYRNNGVYPYANGANLNINITTGKISGNGINFVNSKTSPNDIVMGPGVVQAFSIRTQTGAGGAPTTAITPGSYDVAGTITAIPGSSNQATIQYIWAIPGQGYVVQLGQTLYSTFALAVQAVGKETSFTVYPNLIGNAIPIAALVVTKGCTSLADTGVTAQFFRSNTTGDFFGATAGAATGTLQSAYNNSVEPEILTDSTRDGFTVRRGSAADTDNVIVGQNGAGTNTFTLDGNGKVTTTSDAVINGLVLGRGNGNVLTSTAFGQAAMATTTTMTNATAIGSNALTVATSSNSSTAVGASALIACTTGTSETALGTSSLAEVTIGTNNIGVGVGAGRGNSTGSNNQSQGTDAGRYLLDGTTANANPTGCIYLGHQTKSFAASQTNEIVIGRLANGIGSNSVVLGSDAVTKTALKGRVIQGQTGTIVDNGVDAMQTTGSTTQTGQFKSTLATGTAPLAVASTTLNTNLNSDLLDGLDSTAFALSSNITSASYTPTLTDVSNTSGLTVINANYIKVGNIVTVNLGFQVTPTASTTNSSFTVTFPFTRTSSSTVNVGSGNARDGSDMIGLISQSSSMSNTTVSFKSISSGSPIYGNITITYSTLY